MKILSPLFYILIILLSCSTTKSGPKKVVNPTVYGESINASELKDMLYTYASDEFEGRETGQPGQKKAVEYLKNYYKALGIPSPLGNNDYFQDISSSYLKNDIKDS